MKGNTKQKNLPHCMGHFFNYELLNSDPFWLLTATEIRVLIAFHRKTRPAGKNEAKKMHVPSGYIKNNGQIVFTYSEANKYGISNSTFTRAIDKLISLGFLDIAEYGTNCNPNKYSLSDRWKMYGTSKFKPVHRKKNNKYPVGFATRFTSSKDTRNIEG